jgi:hypothetical protein
VLPIIKQALIAATSRKYMTLYINVLLWEDQLMKRIIWMVGQTCRQVMQRLGGLAMRK